MLNIKKEKIVHLMYPKFLSEFKINIKIYKNYSNIVDAAYWTIVNLLLRLLVFDSGFDLHVNM